MIITTTLEDIADFWAERGFEPDLLYHLDGVSYWKVEIDDKHEMLGHPDYIGLLVKEKMNWRNIVYKRMRPVLYTVKLDKHFADVRDPQGKRAVPLARDKELLKKALTNTETEECPTIVPLKKSEKVHRVLSQAHQSGVDRVLFFATDRFTETFSLEEALSTVWSH